jgi:hypothetical protein
VKCSTGLVGQWAEFVAENHCDENLLSFESKVSWLKNLTGDPSKMQELFGLVVEYLRSLEGIGEVDEHLGECRLNVVAKLGKDVNVTLSSTKSFHEYICRIRDGMRFNPNKKLKKRSWLELWNNFNETSDNLLESQ